VARGMKHVEWWKLLDAEISSVLQKVVKSHISLVINLVDSTALWIQIISSQSAYIASTRSEG